MDRFNVAVKVVQNAGELLRQCRLEEAEVSQKTGHQDLVTRWDRRTEQLLRNEILTAFPRDAIVGEEYPPEAHRTGSVTWYIDPIDGTTNFINQHQNYAISVGCWMEAYRCSDWCWMWSERRYTGESMAAAHGRIRHRSTHPSDGNYRSCC